MTYVLIYLAIGVIAMLQATIRNWKYAPLRDLEDVAIVVGGVVLWLPILISEVPAIYRRLRYKER